MRDARLAQLVPLFLRVEAVRAACRAGESSVSFGLSTAAASAGSLRNKLEYGARLDGPLPDYPVCAVRARTPVGTDELVRRGVLVLRANGPEPLARRAETDAGADAAGFSADGVGREAAVAASHLGVATLATATLGLGLKLALPRLLGPEQLGVLYYSESVGTMVFACLPLGLSAHLMRELPGAPHRARAALSSIVPAQAGLALALLVGLGVFAAQGRDDPAARTCLVVMGAYAAIVTFQRAILRRAYLALGFAAQMARQDVVCRVVLVALVVAALLARGGVVAVASAYLVSELVGLVWLLARARRDGYLGGAFSWGHLSAMVRTSLPFLGVGALVELYGNLDSAMLEHLAGAREVGFYGVAARLRGAGLLGVPILAAAVQPMLAKAWRADRVAFGRLLGVVARAVVGASLPVVFVLMLVPDAIAAWMFGDAFGPSARAIAWLAPAVSLSYLNVLLGAAMNLMRRGGAFLVVTAASLAVNAALNLAGIKYGLAAWGEGGGGAGASLATVVSETAVLVALVPLMRGALSSVRMLGLAAIVIAPSATLALGYDRAMGWPWPWRAFAAVALGLGYGLATRTLRVGDVAWVLHARFGRDRRRRSA
jgi:O-antigen/teichoic acid export membrane protein